MSDPAVKEYVEKLFRADSAIQPAAALAKVLAVYPNANIDGKTISRWASRGGWRDGGSGSKSRAVATRGATQALSVVPIFTDAEKELVLRLLKNNMASLERKVAQGWVVDPTRVKALKKTKTGLMRNTMSLPDRVQRCKDLIPKIEGLVTYKR